MLDCPARPSPHGRCPGEGRAPLQTLDLCAGSGARKSVHPSFARRTHRLTRNSSAKETLWTIACLLLHFWVCLLALSPANASPSLPPPPATNLHVLGAVRPPATTTGPSGSACRNDRPKRATDNGLNHRKGHHQ